MGVIGVSRGASEVVREIKRSSSEFLGYSGAFQEYSSKF